MARRNTTQLAYQAIRIEGALIPANELARLTNLQEPEKTEQTESHYGIPKGLKLLSMRCLTTDGSRFR